MNLRSKTFRPALFALAAATPLAAAQVAIYSNGSPTPGDPGLATGTLSTSGQFAPAGGVWSELQSQAGVANAIGGFSSHLTGGSEGYRFADDFTVTGESGWRIDSISFYAYQTGAPSGFSPFSGINVQIWNGRPGDPGSAVIFGDTTTNRLLSSTFSGIYRIFGSIAPPFPMPPDALRLIWQTDAQIGGLVLPPGTYWLDWQYTSVTPDAEAFSPAVTISATRSLSGWNARQLQTTGSGVWVDVLDTGKPASGADLAQDLPFIVRGWSSCIGDFNGDGLIDFVDYLTFLNLYDAQDPLADLTGDGLIDFLDYLAFLNYYSIPCGG